MDSDKVRPNERDQCVRVVCLQDERWAQSIIDIGAVIYRRFGCLFGILQPRVADNAYNFERLTSNPFNFPSEDGLVWPESPYKGFIDQGNLST